MALVRKNTVSVKAQAVWITKLIQLDTVARSFQHTSECDNEIKYNEKAFRSKAKHPLASRARGLQINKFEQVWGSLSEQIWKCLGVASHVIGGWGGGHVVGKGGGGNHSQQIDMHTWLKMWRSCNSRAIMMNNIHDTVVIKKLQPFNLFHTYH